MTGRKRSSDRGNALVLAVLVLLALTSVGLVSVQRTNSDLMVSSNVVRAAQAQMAGEAGINHAMADVRRYLYDYLYAMEQSGTPELQPKAQSTALTTDYANNVPIVEPEDDDDRMVALAAQNMAYQVRPFGTDEINDMPGYEVGEVCFQVFDFNSKGGLPTTEGETVDGTLSQRDTVVVPFRARVVIGPSRCLQR